MAQILRKNSTDTISLGVFADTSAGQPITSAPLASMDFCVAILGNGTNTNISSLTFAADGSADGLFDLTLTTAVTSAVGKLELYFVDTDRFLPVRREFQVLASAAYDAIYADPPTLLTAKDVGQLYEGTISTVNSQTSYDCDTSISTNDNWNDLTCTIEDVTNGDTCVRRITDVDAANNRIIVASAPTFTVAVSDIVRVNASKDPVASLNNYDPPTRTEATADKNEIKDYVLGLVQLALRSDAAIKADRASELSELNNDEGSGSGSYDNETDSLEHGNVQRINDTAVQGTGISSDKWRG